VDDVENRPSNSTFAVPNQTAWFPRSSTPKPSEVQIPSSAQEAMPDPEAKKYSQGKNLLI
jgi:hypothetical protein